MKIDGVPVSRRKFIAGSAAASILSGIGGISSLHAETASNIHCDVLVCGATPAGIAAAITAARRGQRVVLAEYEDHIGGILSNGLTNTDLNAAHRTAVGGFFNQFTARVVEHYEKVDADSSDKPNVKACRNGFAYEPSLAESLFNQFVAEQRLHLHLLLRHELKQAIIDHGRVTGAVFEDRGNTGRPVRISAVVSIDATYEGDLAAFANASFRLGREARSEFNEPHAGVIYMKFGTTNPQPGSTGEADKAIQAYCFRFTATSHPELMVPIEKPPIYDRSDYHFLLDDIKAGKVTRLGHVFGIYPMPMGKVEFNSSHPLPTTGVPSESLDLAEDCWPWPEATPTQRHVIYQRYLHHNVGMLWFLQNDPELPAVLRNDASRYGWCKDEFVNNNHVPRQVYVREGRRIEGEYFLTEHDGELASGLERTRIQKTSISIVEWPFDSHACHRFDPAHSGVREGYTFVPHATFQVPYGVVVPKMVDGLLVPVACSASHVAYNALRMEPVFMALGEACGEAADLAIAGHVNVRAIPVDRLQQRLLANTGTITYFSDLEATGEAFIALQWLGARGFNKAYTADAQTALTRGEGAERLQRVMEAEGHAWTSKPNEGLSEPLEERDVLEWLKNLPSSGKAIQVASDVKSGEGGLTTEEFALMVYRAMAAA
jgi:hypothetical protein